MYIKRNYGRRRHASRPWEHLNERLNTIYSPVVCEDYNHKLSQELEHFLGSAELDEIKGKANLATQILKIQSRRLRFCFRGRSRD